MTDTDLVERLRGLIARLEKLEGPDREIDGLLFGWLHNTEPCGTFMCGFVEEKFQFRHPDDSPEGRYRAWYVSGDDVPAYTESLDAAVALVERVLPGWSWRVATCCVSDDAWVQPDFNCPVHGERLKREFREDIDWVELTDVDLRPSGRPAIALVIAALRALQEPSK